MSELSAIRAERDRLRAALVAVRTVMRDQGWHIAAENEDVSAETAEMVLAAYEAAGAALDEQLPESGGAARHAPDVLPETAQAERGASDSSWDFGFPREILGEQAIASIKEKNNAMIAGVAANAVFNLNWMRTKEGNQFWAEICFRLLRIAREGR